MKLLIQKGTTSKRLQIFIQDSSVATGAGKTGLAHNTASLSAYYFRDGDSSATAITLATATVGTFTSSGFKEIDATNLPGWYEFDPPNAALATGANSVIFMLKGASNMAPVNIEVQLVSFDPNDSVRAGLTALPNAAAEAAGGLYTRGTGAGQINQPANGQIDANVVKWNGTNVASPATAGYPAVTLKVGTGTGEVNLSSGAVPVTGDLTATMKTSVNAEVLDVMATDTHTEPTSVPNSTVPMKEMIAWLYTLARNKVTQTSTLQVLRNNADSSNIGTAVVSDSAGTFVRGKWG